MKAMKKVLALALALAMTVTAVPVTSADAATAKLKAGKTVSKTYYAGKTHTLKLNGVTAAKVSKTTWKSSNTAAVKCVAKTKGKVSTNIKCVAAGKATITAKVTLKTKKTKTYRATITVKNPTITFNQSSVKIGAGESAALTVTTKPAAKNVTVSYASSDTKVATVDVNGKVTGVAEGSATITATMKCGSVTKTATVDVAVGAVAGELEMTGLVAAKANKLVASFASAVDASAKVSVTKAGVTAEVAGDPSWNADRTELTYTTTAVMGVGTYTVKVTVGTASTEKAVAVEERKVTDIIFKSKTALTSTDKKKAYVYYDVVDQYNESMRSSTSVNWTVSTGHFTEKRALGRLEITKDPAAANTEFMFNELIVVTGVIVRSNVNNSVQLNVGMEESLSTVEMVGFVKKGTSSLITPEQGLPVDFKSEAYYMLYNVYNQDGNIMAADQYIDANNAFGKKQVTFISENVLVIEKIDKDGAPVTINGTEYSAALITPGMQVAKGGFVTIQAIALNTVGQSKITISVGIEKVLTTFNLKEAGFIADGETIEIPFEAFDQNGDPLKDFVSLAKNLTFNKLQLMSTAGKLTLYEKNDGTAGLKYEDEAIGWNNGSATDGVARPVSLNSIVINGNSSNLMLNIADKARPVAVAETKFDKIMVEGNEVTLDIRSGAECFKYIDQYERVIGTTWNADNGFFSYWDGTATNGGFEFSGYTYGVRATYSGNKHIANNSALTSYYNSKDEFVLDTVGGKNGSDPGSPTSVTSSKFWAGNKVATAQSGEFLKFEIVRVKSPMTDWEAVSTVKSEQITVVDIKQVKNISVDNIDMLYVTTNNSDDVIFHAPNGETIDDYVSVPTRAADIRVLPGLNFESKFGYGDEHADQDNKWLKKYRGEVVVKGKYNGVDVTIPTRYYTVTGKKLDANGGDNVDLGGLGANIIDTFHNDAVTWSELYDKTSANFARKTATDALTIKVYELYDNDKNNLGAKLITSAVVSGGAITSAPLATSIKSVTFSDAAPVATKIEHNIETVTVNPQNTVISVLSNGDIFAGAIDNWATAVVPVKKWWANKWYCVVDQYGVVMKNEEVACTISDIVEGSNNYAENSFTVNGNNSKTVSIEGVERTDTFKVTIHAISNPLVSATITATVGADKNAKLDNTKNFYNNDISGDGGLVKILEGYRVAGLD